MVVVLATTAATQTPETLFDFEKEPAGIRALSSEYTLVKAPHGEERHLRWEIKPNQIVYQLRLPLEKDLTAYSWLVFRLRGEGHTPPGVVTIWLRCKQGWFTYPLPAPTTEWKTHRIPLIAFEATSTAKRNAVRSMALRGYLSSERLVVELDDIGVVPDAGGWEAGLPPRLTFEEEAEVATAVAEESRLEVQRESGGTCLAWHVPAKKHVSWLDLRLVPRDIRKKGKLRFRIRADRELPSDLLSIRVYDQRENYLELGLKQIDPGWKTLTIPLGYFHRSGAFDPQQVAYLEWLIWDTQACTLSFDDVEWVEGEEAEASWQHGRGPRLDFKNPESIHAVEASHSDVRSVPGNRGGIAWSVPPSRKWCTLSAGSFPADIRTFGAVSMRLKADRKIGPDEIHVRLYSAEDNYLSTRLPAIGTKWKKLTLNLPDFMATKALDPKGIYEFELVGWDLKPFTLTLDRIELVEGKRKTASWRPTDRDLCARIFGKRRTAKVKTRKTSYFVLQTDSRAALGRFVKTLDDHVEFVRQKLNLSKPREPLPIYVFSNPEGYYDFLERNLGYTADEARATAGVGCGRFFALYYTRPDAPVVVHELTHALVDRLLGPHGGSWLQEGFAVYVETAFERKDPVAEFAVDLRNNRFTPLEEFIATDTLAFTSTTKESGKPARLYRQAGAFFAFLKDGPVKARYPELLELFVKVNTDKRSRVKMMEKLYEKPIAELQKQWVAWGTDKASRKREP